MSKSNKQNVLEQHIKDLSRNIKTTAELEDLTVRSNSSKSNGLKSRLGSCPCAPVA